MTTAQQLFTDARMTQLGDAEGITWPDSAMLVAYNSAVKTLLLMRPDAGATKFILSLVAGSEQHIPADGTRLLRVIRNINADNSIGTAIRPVNMTDLDAMSPDWHIVTGSTVREFGFDPQDPKTFYVYPSPAISNTQKVHITYCKVPADLTLDDLGDELPFDPIYNQAVIEFMLYKLLSGDNTAGQSGTTHIQAAIGMLGGKVAADQANTPARET